MSAYPVLMHTALDATDCRSLAEFYRQFLGLRYRPGDEMPTDGSDDDSDWLVLLDPTGHRVFAFQQVPTLARPTWPAHDVPKQMHHDFRVPNIEELQRQRQRAEQLGATLHNRPAPKFQDHRCSPRSPLRRLPDAHSHAAARASQSIVVTCAHVRPDVARRARRTAILGPLR